MAKEIYQRAYLVKPKQKDLIVSVDFGQGEDVSVMIKSKKEKDGTIKILSYDFIGKAYDFDDDKIRRFLDMIENNEIKI